MKTSIFRRLLVTEPVRILAIFFVLLSGAEKAGAAPIGVSLSGLDVAYEVSYVIETSPGRETLVVNTDVLVQRPPGLGRTADVEVTYRLRLTEGNDGTGRLVDEQRISFTYSVPSPYLQVHSEVIKFDPPSILDGTVDHHLQVEVLHDDDPIDPGGSVVDDTDTIVDRLFHTSGVLSFGSIATTLLDLLEEPGPPFLSTWPLKVADGVIDSSGIHFQARTPLGIAQAITVSRDNTSGDLSVTADRVRIQADGSGVDWGVWNDVTVSYIEMSRTGIVAGELMIPLPDGVGWRLGNPGTLNPVLDGGSTQATLDEDLTMTGSTGAPLALGTQFVSDCYAVAFEPDAWTFSPTGMTLHNPGTEFLRKEIYDQWKMIKGPENPDSNDAYLYALGDNADADLVLTPDGASTTLGFDVGAYFSHFPLASNQHGSGQMVIEDNLVNPVGSQLDGYQSLVLYGSGCRIGPDPNAIPERRRRYRLNTLAATFVPGGGLHGTGNLSAAVPPQVGEAFPQIQNLQVGATENDDPVHEAIATTTGQLYIPGPQVLDASTDDGAVRHLLDGLLPESDFDFERTGTNAYIHDGNGKYAGLNFQYAPGLDFVSRIGGAVSPPYPASDCFRGYVRISGYTGVIEQDPDDQLTTLPVLGFDVDFDSFGFGYLSNSVQTSLADGTITTPYPADLVVDFEDLMLNCCGNPTSMVMTGPAEHELPYWEYSHLDLLLATAAFDTGLDECNTDDATLRIGIVANINHLPGTHSGYLHVTSDGRLGHYDDGVENDTYISLAPHLKLAGFEFLPTRDAYPNAYDEDEDKPDSGPGEGRYNLVGEGDWAFFNNGDFHAHVHGQEDPLGENAFGPVGIKGGWQSGGGKNLFNDPEFDKLRRSYPPGGASTLEDYMKENGEHLVKADSNAWFGLLDYDVEWSPLLKMFRSPGAEEQNLLLVNLDSKVRRLQENTAHLEFNAQFGGLAGVGLKSLLEDSLDDAAGYLSSSIAAGVEEELGDGVESLSQLLDDELAVLLQQSIVPLLEEQFFNLPINIHTAGYTPLSVDVQFDKLPGVMTQMADFNSGLENVLDVTDRLQERLEKVRGLLGAILTITDVSNVAQFAGFVSSIAGEIDLPIPEIELGDDAIMQIAADAQSGLNGEGDLAQFASWLSEVRTVILEIDNLISEIQDLLEAGEEFANELQDIIATVDFVDFADGLKDEVNAYLSVTVNAAGSQPGDYSPAEIDDAIRAMIRDRLYEMDFTAQMHNIIKRWIEPVTDAVELAVHEALNAVAAAIIDAAAPYLQQLDDAIASFTGFGNPVKSAKLRGDAIIVGNRLKKLDLLGTAVLTPVEPTEIQVDALFQWCEYRSDGTSVCGVEFGELNRSISLFATGAPVKAGFPLGNRVSVGAKFTIPENDLPGMSGFFELEQGGNFPAEAFRINNFNANMGFGGPKSVAYLSAFVDSTFGTWDMTGGICIGRICDLEPVSFYKGVEDIPGYSPMLVPRTGLLVYASGKYNLIDLGCLVEASVGAGVGGYFFLLDDLTREYGGRIEGNVSGKALCLIKVNGSAELAGGKTGDVFYYNGEACLKGKIGIGKLSKKFERCIGTDYNSGDGWMIDY